MTNQLYIYLSKPPNTAIWYQKYIRSLVGENFHHRVLSQGVVAELEKRSPWRSSRLEFRGFHNFPGAFNYSAAPAMVVLHTGSHQKAEKSLARRAVATQQDHKKCIHVISQVLWGGFMLTTQQITLPVIWKNYLAIPIQGQGHSLVLGTGYGIGLITQNDPLGQLPSGISMLVQYRFPGGFWKPFPLGLSLPHRARWNYDLYDLIYKDGTACIQLVVDSGIAPKI